MAIWVQALLITTLGLVSALLYCLAPIKTQLVESFRICTKSNTLVCPLLLESSSQLKLRLDA